MARDKGVERASFLHLFQHTADKSQGRLYCAHTFRASSTIILTSRASSTVLPRQDAGLFLALQQVRDSSPALVTPEPALLPIIGGKKQRGEGFAPLPMPPHSRQVARASSSMLTLFQPAHHPATRVCSSVQGLFSCLSQVVRTKGRRMYLSILCTTTQQTGSRTSSPMIMPSGLAHSQPLRPWPALLYLVQIRYRAVLMSDSPDQGHSPRLWW